MIIKKIKISLSEIRDFILSKFNVTKKDRDNYNVYEKVYVRARMISSVTGEPIDDVMKELFREIVVAEVKAIEDENSRQSFSKHEYMNDTPRRVFTANKRKELRALAIQNRRM